MTEFNLEKTKIKIRIEKTENTVYEQARHFSNQPKHRLSQIFS